MIRTNLNGSVCATTKQLLVESLPNYMVTLRRRIAGSHLSASCLLFPSWDFDAMRISFFYSFLFLEDSLLRLLQNRLRPAAFITAQSHKWISRTRLLLKWPQLLAVISYVEVCYLFENITQTSPPSPGLFNEIGWKMKWYFIPFPCLYLSFNAHVFVVSS